MTKDAGDLGCRRPASLHQAGIPNKKPPSGYCHLAVFPCAESRHLLIGTLRYIADSFSIRASVTFSRHAESEQASRSLFIQLRSSAFREAGSLDLARAAEYADARRRSASAVSGVEQIRCSIGDDALVQSKLA